MKSSKESRKKLEFTDSTIVTDPFGSYTGKPKDLNEIPIQDADDL